jgi:release factor glutamine methyltransferase
MVKIYLIILNFLRSSRFLTLILWGIKIDTKLHDTFWDLTTLVLRKEMINIRNKKKFLDMGCGQFALIGQFFKKKNLNSNVVSVDIYEKFVKNSIITARYNNIKIKVIKSNLFSNLKKEKFDLISFNPPYVPSKRDITEKSFKKIRYSGNDGTLITLKFLNQLRKHLLPDGEVLLGINTFYVSESKCIKLIENKFKIKKITRMKFNSSVVFKIVPI